jgi:hypothetical protein
MDRPPKAKRAGASKRRRARTTSLQIARGKAPSASYREPTVPAPLLIRRDERSLPPPPARWGRRAAGAFTVLGLLLAAGTASSVFWAKPGLVVVVGMFASLLAFGLGAFLQVIAEIPKRPVIDRERELRVDDAIVVDGHEVAPVESARAVRVERVDKNGEPHYRVRVELADGSATTAMDTLTEDEAVEIVAQLREQLRLGK